MDLVYHGQAYRDSVAQHLKEVLPGKNLFDLARELQITIARNGNKNKGWVGQTLEKVANLNMGNAQHRDGIDFELKSTSLRPSEAGWVPKETIKITQLNPQKILDETFETSALWNKLSRLVLVGCHHASADTCRVISINAIDITPPDLIGEIKTFWADVRYSICSGEFADVVYAGTALDWVQLRPTGDGTQRNVCPVSGRSFPARAFYATKRLISRILDL